MCDCIEEVKKMIIEVEKKYEGYGCGDTIILNFKELIEQLEKLPQEPSRYEIAMEVYGEWWEIYKEKPLHTKQFFEWLEEKNK